MQSFSRTSRPRRLLAVCILFAALPIGAAAFLAASLGSAAAFDLPGVFLGTGIAISAVVVFVLAYFALRLLGLRKPWPMALISGVAISTLIFALFSMLVLRPLIPVEEQFSGRVPNGVEMWELETGSAVAVRKFSGQGVRRKHPVVFVHGGPGGYSVSLKPTVEVISRLSEYGYDVYFYDQIGGGLSARLPDIADYSVNRHLDDLKAVTTRIGADKVILIGSSWGAALSASYMAKYPEDVSAAVFSGAAPIFLPDWAETGDGGLDERLTPAMKAKFSNLVETPRLFAALILADINPRAASNFASERELGSLFDKVANDFYIPLAVCDTLGIDAISSGYGFWSNRMTVKTLRERIDDPKPALRDSSTPVLMLRGACDYKNEEVFLQYVSVFRNVEFEVFDNAGHMLLWEEPERYLQRVRAFLKAKAVPR